RHRLRPPARPDHQRRQKAHAEGDHRMGSCRLRLPPDPAEHRMSKSPEARSERVIIGFNRDEWKIVNAMRLSANREISMAIFCRSIILDVVADDQAAHAEEAHAD